MADDVQLTLHAWPWAPTPDTKPVLELNRYDVPLLGVFAQGTSHFLFHCLAGELEAEQVWLYAAVSAEEVERLDLCHEPDAVHRCVDALEADRPVTLAHAHEEVGILASVGDVRLGDVRSHDLRRSALARLAAQVQARARELQRLSAAAS